VVVFIVCFSFVLGSYLKKLKTQVLDKEFICPLTKEKKLFVKHSELDDYANELFTKINIKDFERDYPGDYALLKAFDRAFYIGKYNEDKKDPEEKDMNNMMNFAPKKCPFGDPVQTSYVVVVSFFVCFVLVFFYTQNFCSCLFFVTIFFFRFVPKKNSSAVKKK